MPFFRRRGSGFTLFFLCHTLRFMRMIKLCSETNVRCRSKMGVSSDTDCENCASFVPSSSYLALSRYYGMGNVSHSQAILPRALISGRTGNLNIRGSYECWDRGSHGCLSQGPVTIYVTMGNS